RSARGSAKKMADHQRLRILIAEDDALLQDALSTALTMEGYSASSVGSQEALFSAINATRWNLILLDMLGAEPGATASSLLQLITAAATNTPLLLMTGSTSAAEWAESNARFARVLRKPFNLQSLLDAVSNSLTPGLPQSHYGARKEVNPSTRFPPSPTIRAAS